MKDYLALLQTCQNEAKAGAPLALATVVKVEGSAYRRPGARMLIYPDGRRTGSVSGGCLEADVVVRAQQVMKTGQPDYVLYDSRNANGDVVLELGCKGAVGILIELATSPEVLSSLEFLASFQRERGQGAQATVFHVGGDCPIRVGDRLLRGRNGGVQGRLCLPRIAPVLREELALALQRGQARTGTFPIGNGYAEMLFEPVQSPIALLLCGAGQDAIPLSQCALQLGWQVTILDHRPSLLTPERFPGAATLLVPRPERLREVKTLDRRTAAVIMTHSYAQDKEWLQHLLPSPLGYLGLLGPRKRAEQLRTDLSREGFLFDAERLARLHSPTGLDIGSETPEEIALAIVAEIQAMLHNASGGFLRERTGSIHATTRSPESGAHAFYQVMPCPLSV